MSNSENFTKAMWRKEIIDDANAELMQNKETAKHDRKMKSDDDIDYSMDNLDKETNIRAVLQHLEVCCISYDLNFKEILDAFKDEL